MHFILHPNFLKKIIWITKAKQEKKRRKDTWLELILKKSLNCCMTIAFDIKY